MKFRIISLTIIGFLILTACSGGKWDKSDPNMPEGLRQVHEEKLTQNLDLLKEDAKDEKALFEVAFRYQQLGDFKKAEEYYKKLLEQNAVHYAAINNLADIYEQVEQYDLAAEQIKELYKIDQSSLEVIKDTVRILLKANDPDNAIAALENFAKVTENNPKLVTVISDLYESIFQYRKQHEKK